MLLSMKIMSVFVQLNGVEMLLTVNISQESATLDVSGDVRDLLNLTVNTVSRTLTGIYIEIVSAKKTGLVMRVINISVNVILHVIIVLDHTPQTV